MTDSTVPSKATLSPWERQASNDSISEPLFFQQGGVQTSYSELLLAWLLTSSQNWGCGGIQAVAVLVGNQKMTWSKLTFNIMAQSILSRAERHCKLLLLCFTGFAESLTLWVTATYNMYNLLWEAEMRSLSFIKIQSLDERYMATRRGKSHWGLEWKYSRTSVHRRSGIKANQPFMKQLRFHKQSRITFLRSIVNYLLRRWEVKETSLKKAASTQNIHYNGKAWRGGIFLTW